MYIVSRDNKIIAVYDAKDDSTIKKLHPSCDILSVPENCSARTGEDIRQLNPDGSRKSDEVCIVAGILPLPSDKVIEGKTLRDKTLEEKYSDGTLIMPKGYKLSTDKNFIEPMTAEELKEAKIITVAEYNTIKNSEICAQIAFIESKQPRALREKALDISGAKERLEKIESDISILRGKLR